MNQAATDRQPMPPTVANKQQEAQERAFAQCVHALRGTLRATPAGWALVAWLASGIVPREDLLRWVAIFALPWVFNQFVLRDIERAGSSLER